MSSSAAETRTDPDPPARAVAARAAAAATAWLDALDEGRRAVATGGNPGDPAADEERHRWYYTPTDHGGLRLNQMSPTQQGLAMQLVASGLSEAGYVTVSTVLGLENVLDRVEGWGVDWGRERGRDPGCYYLRVFGDPASGTWSWRFGGHHVSLNVLVVEHAVASTTPCFLGADPARAPLLGPVPLRPLAGAEDLARDLVRSLDGQRRAAAVLLPRAPGDIVGGNRPRVADGDETLALSEIWRGRFTEPRLAERLAAMDRTIEEATGLDAADHRALALTDVPKGLPASALAAEQRDLLRALLGTYLGRVPDELAAVETARVESVLDEVHVAWAGGLDPADPHYYRLQGPRLLIEFDNTQRKVNHAHSVWRNPQADFGHDVLGAHRAAHPH